jgi:Pyruvate/2-oxoacid:ferredoxin oxidoreductase gamma subunit
MPTYMDEHRIEGVKADDVAKAHAADVAIQDKHGVNYRSYWVDEAGGRVWCLVDAPDKEAATRVHQEAHGLVAHDLHEVKEG